LALADRTLELIRTLDPVMALAILALGKLPENLVIPGAAASVCEGAHQTDLLSDFELII
jgi:hypothetical protein